MVGAAPATSLSCWLQVGKSLNSSCAPWCSKGCLLLEQLFTCLGVHGCGGNKKHSRVFHSDGLSSILTPKSVWTRVVLLPGEHLEGLEAESTSST